MKNTKKEFYQHWSREQMTKELCRLNQVLLNCVKICNKDKGGRK